MSRHAEGSGTVYLVIDQTRPISRGAPVICACIIGAPYVFNACIMGSYALNAPANAVISGADILSCRIYMQAYMCIGHMRSARHARLVGLCSYEQPTCQQARCHRQPVSCDTACPATPDSFLWAVSRCAVVISWSVPHAPWILACAR